MRKFLDYCDKVIIFILVIMLCVMIVSGTMQVIWRYLLKASLSWSEELMRYLYVWATLLGIPCGIRRKSFACIDSLLDFVGKKSPIGEKAMRIAGFAVQVFVFSLLVFYGWQFAVKGMRQHSPAMGMNMALVYAAFPVGGALGLLGTLEEIYDAFFAKKKPGISPSEA